MKEEIKYILSLPIHKILNNHKILKDFYFKYKISVCWTCPNAIQANYNRLHNLEIKEEVMNNNILRLRKGVMIDTIMAETGPIGHFTNANITDEISIELIESGWKDSFENPEDLDLAIESFVEKIDPSKEEKEEQKTKEVKLKSEKSEK